MAGDPSRGILCQYAWERNTALDRLDIGPFALAIPLVQNSIGVGRDPTHRADNSGRDFQGTSIPPNLSEESVSIAKKTATVANACVPRCGHERAAYGLNLLRLELFLFFFFFAVGPILRLKLGSKFEVSCLPDWFTT